MPDFDRENDPTLFSPDEMKDWLKMETERVRIVSERRIAEATAIIEEYAAGKLTPAEANTRIDEHEQKWGEVTKDRAIAGDAQDAAISKVFGVPRQNTSGRVR